MRYVLVVSQQMIDVSFLETPKWQTTNTLSIDSTDGKIEGNGCIFITINIQQSHYMINHDVLLKITN